MCDCQQKSNVNLATGEQCACVSHSLYCYLLLSSLVIEYNLYCILYELSKKTIEPYGLSHYTYQLFRSCYGHRLCTKTAFESLLKFQNISN